MRTEKRLKGWYEQDALTGWRHDFYWKPGQRKSIKRSHARRVRRTSKIDIRKLDD